MKPIFFLIALFTLVTCCTQKPETSKQPTELQKVLAQKPFLVDVRTPEEFNAGSVKGAVNIPLPEVENQISQFQNKGTIVVFCRSGKRSGQAKAILESKGIKNVTNGGPWQDVEEARKTIQ